MDNIPKLDIPREFIAGKNVSGDTLRLYGKFPCKLKAGVFVLCTSGRIKATINLSEYMIEKNDLITLPPGTFIQIRQIEGETELFFAGFSSNLVKNVNFFPYISDRPVIRLTEGLKNLTMDYISLLTRTEHYAKLSTNPEMTGNVLNLFLNMVSVFYKKTEQWDKNTYKRDKEIYKNFIILVREHYSREHSVSYYAKELGITLQHFCNTIKKVSGKTALQIITSIIIMDAKAQLRSTDHTVKSISETLGFNNQAFFNKYFKQHVGMTPQEYRNSR